MTTTVSFIMTLTNELSETMEQLNPPIHNWLYSQLTEDYFRDNIETQFGELLTYIEKMELIKKPLVLVLP